MNKRSVLALVVTAFLLGIWVGSSMKSPAAAQAPSPQKQMFREVVVADKSGEQGAVYMVYHGPGQICPVSTTLVRLKQEVKKPEKPNKPTGRKPR